MLRMSLKWGGIFHTYFELRTKNAERFCILKQLIQLRACLCVLRVDENCAL